MPEQEWYADGLSFSCTQCGNCCSGPHGYVWFDDEEALAMSEFLGLDLRTFLRRYAHTHNGNWTLNEVAAPGGRGFDCVFLRRDDSGKALCGIYQARPQQCRTWPFWPENLRNKEAWDDAGKKCPGINKGNFYPVEKVRLIRDSNPE